MTEPMRKVRFDDYLFDVETGELLRDGSPVTLRPLATRALSLLVQRPARLVTHEQLRSCLWGEMVLEWETGLHQVIRQVRLALGDDARAPRYVETVARRGYRFVASVAELDTKPAPVPVAGPSPERRPRPRLARRRTAAFLGGFLAFPVLLLLVCLLLAAM